MRRSARGAVLSLLCFTSCAEDTVGDAGSMGGAGSGGASSASGSTGSMTSSVSTGGTGGRPILCGVPASDIPPGECDLLQQDCPPGLGCEPEMDGGSWTTKCVQGSGLKPAEASCNSSSECQTGLGCVLGACAPPCCVENDEPCGGGTCNAALSYGPHEVQYCSYLAICRIFTPDVCDAGKDCHILNNEGYAVCVAPSNPLKLEGEACDFLNECGEMQSCWPPGAPASVCRYHCDLAASGAAPGLGGCPAAQTCMDYDIGYPGVGVCTP